MDNSLSAMRNYIIYTIPVDICSFCNVTKILCRFTLKNRIACNSSVSVSEASVKSCPHYSLTAFRCELNKYAIKPNDADSHFSIWFEYFVGSSSVNNNRFGVQFVNNTPQTFFKERAIG